MSDFSRPTIGQPKAVTKALPCWGKLPSSRHTFCTDHTLPFVRGATRKASDPLAGHVLTYLCILAQLPSFQPSVEVFLRFFWERIWGSVLGKEGETLKIPFSHLFNSLPQSFSTLPSPQPPGPWNYRSLLFGSLSTMTQMSMLIHLILDLCAIPWGEMEWGMEGCGGRVGEGRVVVFL